MAKEKQYTFLPQESNRFAQFSSKVDMGRMGLELLPLSGSNKHKVDTVSVTMTGLFSECYVDDEALMKENPQPNTNMGIRGICGNVISCKTFKPEDSFGGVTKISLEALLAMSPEDRTHGKWPSQKKDDNADRDKESSIEPTHAKNEEKFTADGKRSEHEREPYTSQPPEKKQRMNKDE